jgi:hypothetical protein
MARNSMDDLTAPKTANPGEEGSKETVKTRQAVTGHGVRYVLGISLVLVIIAFALVIGFVR